MINLASQSLIDATKEAAMQQLLVRIAVLAIAS
jgi:hypothetical protein